MSTKNIPEIPDLHDKVVSITIADDNTNHDLLNPRFELQAGRMFIVGSTPKGATESDWTLETLCSVAWDRVTDYFLFESLEHYERAIRISAAFHENDEK